MRNKVKKIKVGVVFGGRSGEHEVSIVSAQAVMQALNPNTYEVIPIGITKQGSWVAGAEAVKFLKDGISKLPYKTFLPADPTSHELVAVAEEGSGKLPAWELDVIFPVLHGPYGEDGTIQGMLELANIPYVGGGVLGSAVAMDKVIQKHLCGSAGIAQVAYVPLLASAWQQDRNTCVAEIENKLAYPIFTKPANLGSSVGITKCHNQAELLHGLDQAAKFDRKIIVEQGIESPREIEVSVLGNDQPRASVPGEIIPSNEFYDYDAKYVDGKSAEKIPAELPKAVIQKIQAIAIQAFKTLDLAGMARVDFLVARDSQDIYLNEVNTIPGFTSISMYPKLWQASGLLYPQLLDRLIELAFERHQRKNQLATSYTPKTDWHKD